MGTWQISRKDLLILGRDRRALITLLVLPMVFIAVIGLSTGQLLGWRNENTMLQVSIVDEDGGELAGRIVDALDNQNNRGLDVLRLDDREEAESLARDGERAAIIIGSDFQQRVEEMPIGEIGYLIESRVGRRDYPLDEYLDFHIETGEMLPASGWVIETIISDKVGWAVLGYKLRHDDSLRSLLQIVGGGAAGLPSTSAAPEPETASEDHAVRTIYDFVVPGFTVMFMYFLINIMARSFIAERELGTLRRMRASPIPYGAVLAGKTIPFLFVSLGQGVLLFLFGKLLFSMDWGREPLMLLPVIAATALAATTLGMLVAVIVRSDAQVSAYATLLVITLAGISGCLMPRDWLPEPMQWISLGTPHAWSVLGFQELLQTAHPRFAVVWRNCAVLVAFSAAFFGLAWWRFRRSG